MNEEERISRNLLLFMYIGCLVLLVLVAAACIFYSPKSPEPSFSAYSLSDESFSSDGAFTSATSENPDGSLVNDVFPIKINTATSEELQLIPNIGPSTAKLILDYRNEYGTIVSFRELLSIDGIGEKTVEILEEYCVIN